MSVVSARKMFPGAAGKAKLHFVFSSLEIGK